MNKFVFLLFSILVAVPALADDLQPVAQDQAIQQYQDFWKTETPDPMNHVVWKVYVYRAVPPGSHPDSAPEFVMVGLSPFHNYYVRLNINQLYNFLWPVPKRGDVIVVSGRIRDHRDFRTILPTKEVVAKTLTMDLDGASALPNEHFDPAATPIPTPGTAPAALPVASPQASH